MHSFLRRSQQLQYCSLLMLRNLPSRCPLTSLWLINPSVKKFWISKALSFSLCLTTRIPTDSFFFDISVVGAPFSNMHTSGIRKRTFRGRRSREAKSRRKGSQKDSLRRGSSGWTSLGGGWRISWFWEITIFWQRWHRQPQLLSWCTILSFLMWGLAGNTWLMMFLSSICLLNLYYITLPKNPSQPALQLPINFVSNQAASPLNIKNSYFPWWQLFGRKGLLFYIFSIKMEVLNSKSSNKENRGSSPSKELQKMKIQLSDQAFQYHKLEEDFAQQRAKLTIDFHKEKNHLSKLVKDLKAKNDSDNEDWAMKVDQLRSEKAQALSSLAQDLHRQMQAKEKVLRQQFNLLYQGQIQNLEQQAEELRGLLKKREAELKQGEEEALRSLRISFGQKEKQVEKKHSKQVQTLKAEYQQRMSHFQFLYKKEQKLKIQSEHQLEAKIRQETKQNKILQGINNSIIQDNQDLQSQITSLKERITQLEHHQTEIEKSHLKQCQSNERNHLHQLAEARQRLEGEKQLLEEAHEEEVKGIKEGVLLMEGVFREKERLWEERGKKMLELYERREARKEDVKAIEQLEVQLLKKDFMLEKERSELKYCRLQLQNMEEIYEKMFISNSSMSKLKTKSFKVKKIKAYSNKSMIENRRSTIDDKN